MTLGCWQPVGISLEEKKIAISPEVTLPSDSWQVAPQGAHSRKTQPYSQLFTALQVYVSSGWTVEILWWVVGARGMVRANLLTPAFKLIPKQKWTGIMEATVRAPVEVLAYMNRISFSGPRLVKTASLILMTRNRHALLKRTS